MDNNKINNIKSLVEIDKNEVLRYLQYKNQDIKSDLLDIIDQSIEETKKIINPRFMMRKYSIKKKKLFDKKSQVILEGTNLILESNDVYDLLLECDECILIAATLGLEIEKEIRKLTYTDLTKGVIIDSCATTAIEEVCDILQDDIAKKLLKEDKYITYRYSPGYGDLPIDINEDIINLLNTSNKIGLTITKDKIMIPRKSVVAIIGISENKSTYKQKSCLECSNYNTCKYKKGDDNYGCKGIHKK